MANSSTASLLQMYPIITSANFPHWKLRLTTILEANGVLSAINVSSEDAAQLSVDESRSFLQKDVLARNLILRSITDKHIGCVKEAKTSYQMMKNLSKVFEQGSKSPRFILMEKLFSIKYTKNEDLQEFFNKMDSIFTGLGALGGKMDEQDKIYCLLVKLNKCFGSEVAAIDATNDELRMSIVKNKLLLSAEIERKSRETSVNNPVPQELKNDKRETEEEKLLKKRPLYIRCKGRCNTCELVTVTPVLEQDGELRNKVTCKSTCTISMLKCNANDCKCFLIDCTRDALNRRINYFLSKKTIAAPVLFEHANTHGLEFKTGFNLIVLKRLSSSCQSPVLRAKCSRYIEKLNAYEHPGLNFKTTRKRGSLNTHAASGESVPQPSGSNVDHDDDAASDDDAIHDADSDDGSIHDADSDDDAIYDADTMSVSGPELRRSVEALAKAYRCTWPKAYSVHVSNHK